MEMTNERWQHTCDYLIEVFGRPDAQLATLMTRAVEAGLPDIAVSADVGRLLKILTSMCRDGRGAERALELGTLGGFSAIWIARGLAANGRLITLEPEPRHAAFARSELLRAGVADRIEVREQAGLDALPGLRREFGDASFDLVFLDAIKTEYSEYFEHAQHLLRPGGLLLADNVLGGGTWWIDQQEDQDASRDAVDAFNRRVARHQEFESVALPIREGVMIARKRAG